MLLCGRAAQPDVFCKQGIVYNITDNFRSDSSIERFRICASSECFVESERIHIKSLAF